MATETILVTGGCGFIGYHVLKTLQAQHQEWNLHGLSRNPSRNLIKGVQYHAADVTSYEDVSRVFKDVSPTAIIHTASPAAVGNRADGSCFRTNVDGTRCLLDCALVSQTVKAFVYTSSVLVVEGKTHHMASEGLPIKTESSRSDDYSKSKALAETMVLAANDSTGMLTASLRLPSTYGERDEQNIAEGIKAWQRGESKIQIGDNTNKCDWLSAHNAAQAHFRALTVLLTEHKKPPGMEDKSAAGKAFFITDGDPLPFWNHFRLIWRAAGDSTSEREIWKIPPWVVMGVAAVVEACYWVFTLETRKPKALRRDLLEMTFLERTYCIDRACERLGYLPVRDRDVNVEEGIRWYLDLNPTQ
ncbi:MAG: hypothetical protein Q9159_002716 [Coniocarpon cinnabarinum]